MTKSLLTSLLAVQSEAPTLPKDATNPHFKSKYTPLDTIVQTIGPILQKHGLVWMTLPGIDAASGEPTLTYRLAHAETGEVLEGSMPLLLTKKDAQSHGSAITYARRYALCSVLNLVADDDDDGHAAARQPTRPPGAASEAQLKYAKSLLRENKVKTGDLRSLLRSVGFAVSEDANPVPCVDELSSDQAKKLIEFLKGGV